MRWFFFSSVLLYANFLMIQYHISLLSNCVVLTVCLLGVFFVSVVVSLYVLCATKKKYMQRLFFSAPLAIDLSCSFIGLSAPFFASASLHVHPHGSVTIHHYSFPFLSMKQDMKLSTKMVEITSSHQRSFFFSKKCTRSLNVHFVLIKYFLFLLTLIGAQFLFACR